jgi:integrase
MAKRENFTSDRVSGFKCLPGKQQTIYWDAKAPGLGLRVTASGAKSYIFETKLHGKTLRLTIGDVRTWAIGKAQQEATRLKSLTDQGTDPRQLRAEQQAKAEATKVEAMRQSLTFGEVWPLYIEANKSSWGERYLADHIRLAARGGESRKRSKSLTIAAPLSSLFSLSLTDLTGDRVEAWLKDESSKRATSAAQSYRLLRTFIIWANKSGYGSLIPSDAYSASGVKKAIPKSNAKDDCLQREQLPGWFAAVQKISNPVISAYLQALLITGARRGELIELRWQDVDFKWKTMTIRDKIEGQRTIPLTPYVASLLQDLKYRNETPPSVRQLRKINESGEKLMPSPWVFFSRTSANGKLVEPRPAHLLAIETAGLPHLTIHGLRRSFGTLCEWVEVPIGISAQIMGHKPSALAEKHYRRRPIDLLRLWHEKIEAWILEQAGIVFKPHDEKIMTLVK